MSNIILKKFTKKHIKPIYDNGFRESVYLQIKDHGINYHATITTARKGFNVYIQKWKDIDDHVHYPVKIGDYYSKNFNDLKEGINFSKKFILNLL